jgi:transcription elongation GreA/GreB family factor
MSVANLNLETGTATRGIPMTAEVFRRLQENASELAAELPRLRALAREHGVSGDPETPTVLGAADLQLASRKLEMLRRVLADTLVVEPDGHVVVGSRVTVHDDHGEEDTYELVAPGEADARSGRISPDSPMGTALLGRQAGEVIQMEAPGGRVKLTVSAVN